MSDLQAFPAVRPPSARVIGHWALGEPVSSERLPGGNWRIETAAGRFFLRRFTGAGPRQIEFRHRVTAALAAAGLPVPAPLPSTGGQGLVTVNRRRYALYPWIEGRRRHGLALQLAECWDLGALLGRIHGELGKVLPPIQQTLLVPTPGAADAIAAVDRLLAAGRADGLAEQRLRRRRILLTELAGYRPADAEAYTVGYVHGGFQTANLLYGTDGTVAAILDWDGLSVAPFAGELVRAATLSFGRPEGRGLDLSRVTAFVAGYARCFHLDPGEIRSAVYRLWWERLCDLSPDAAALVEWWSLNLEQTLDVFATADEARAAS